MIYIGTPEKPDELRPLFDVHYGPVIGLDVLAPGNELVVSVRQDWRSTSVEHGKRKAHVSIACLL